MFDIISYFYTTFQLVVKRTPYFGSLSRDTYKTLIRNNLKAFGSLNSLLAFRETNALDHPAFQTGCQTIYGTEPIAKVREYIARLDSNGTFVRVMIFILAFCTNTRFVSFDSSAEIGSESTAIEIMNLQNIFISMFWKYLLYQYNFTEAVRRFSYFVKYIVDVIQSTYEEQNAQHFEVVERTTRLLTMDD